MRNRRAQNDAINVYDREERGHNAVDGHSGLVALLLQLLDNRLNSADGTRKAWVQATSLSAGHFLANLSSDTQENILNFNDLQYKSTDKQITTPKKSKTLFFTASNDTYNTEKFW